MQPAILLVEDDESIVMGIAGFLKKHNFRIYSVGGVEAAKRWLTKKLPSLVLLDWNLEDGTGDQLCLWIRERWERLPIIYLTVRGDTSDVLKGFQAGADDYMVKPFDLEVLYSRITAVLRRTGNLGGSILLCGPICVDKNSSRAFYDNREVILSSLEYQLLVMLLEHKDRTITREYFLEHIWDSNGSFVNDNTLTVAMKRLREKLHNPSCIKTLRSLGYRMEEEG